MNVHEYQAKSCFGVRWRCPGELATTPEEAERAAKNLGTPVVVVKAQVHGRPRQGRRREVAKSPAEAKTAASEILGMTLHTPQTRRKASWSARSTSRPAATSRTTSTSRSSIARRRSSRSSRRPRAGWRSRRSPRNPREDPDRAGRPERRAPRPDASLGFQLGFDKPLLDKLAFVRGLFDLFLQKDCCRSRSTC